MTELSPEAEVMIEKHMEWLNGWQAHWDKEHKLGKGFSAVTRRDYDGFELPDGGWCEDVPRLYVDQTVGDGTRLILLTVSPFHDEGGPGWLFGWFINYDSPPEWELDLLVYEFDTQYSMIWGNGKFGSMPEEREELGT